MDYIKALQDILKICAESSEYTRRTQAIHDIAMRGLGMTENQRAERHTKAAMRSEEYKEARNHGGCRKAKRAHIAACERDTGEVYKKQHGVFREGQ
jgi:hypothetical protein